MRFLALLLLVVVAVAAAPTHNDKSSEDRRVCKPYEQKKDDPSMVCASDGSGWLCELNDFSRRKRNVILSPRCFPGDTKYEPGKICTCPWGYNPRWSCRWKLRLNIGRR